MLFLLQTGIATGVLLLLGFAAWLGVQWQAIQARVQLARSRLTTLQAAYEDAERLAAARTRFRRRQQAVEGALATGTTGLEDVHRSLAGHGSGGDGGGSFYARLRRLNGRVGRSVSALFAPRQRRHSESLAEWRERVEPDDTSTNGPAPSTADTSAGQNRSQH